MDLGALFAAYGYCQLYHSGGDGDSSVLIVQPECERLRTIFPAQQKR